MHDPVALRDGILLRHCRRDECRDVCREKAGRRELYASVSGMQRRLSGIGYGRWGDLQDFLQIRLIFYAPQPIIISVSAVP